MENRSLTSEHDYCHICGDTNKPRSKKHPKVCVTCESSVSYCVICCTEITDNGQPYSLVIKKDQKDTLDKLIHIVNDNYQFKSANKMELLDYWPDSVNDYYLELDNIIFNDNSSEEAVSRAYDKQLSLVREHIDTLIGISELWFCITCENRLERMKESFCVDNVIKFLKSGSLSGRKMITDLTLVLNGEKDESAYI